MALATGASEAITGLTTISTKAIQNKAVRRPAGCRDGYWVHRIITL
jgi:hypothetical protein